MFVKMKFCALLLIILFQSVGLFGQVSGRDLHKIQHFFKNGFQAIPTNSDYPYSEQCEDCIYQPSLTYLNDTTGVIFNNEYLLFRHPLKFQRKTEILKWIATDYVKVGEYQEFQNYVRDSIARDKMYFALKDNDEASCILNYDEIFYDEGSLEGVDFDPSDRQLNRSVFTLNWKYKFSYSDINLQYALQDMYLPIPERYYNQKIFDERKWHYRYYDVQNISTEPTQALRRHKLIIDHFPSTFANMDLWAGNSQFDRDIWSIHAQLYKQICPEENMLGITGMQVNGFCHWKQEQLQQKFDKAGLEYIVVVSPPTKQDLEEINAQQKNYTFPENDYTVQWRITTKEYATFLKSVRDSILAEKLYYSIPDLSDKLELVDHPTTFYNERTSQIEKVDSLNWIENRLAFPLVLDNKIVNKYPKLVQAILLDEVYEKAQCTFWSNNVDRRSVIGEFELTGAEMIDFPIDTLQLQLIITDSKNFVGLDRNDDWINRLGQSTGVRSHSNYSKFFTAHVVNAKPEQVLSTESNELIQGLTYDQAVAFYYWKYPMFKINNKSELQDYVLPDEEQFSRIQKGEQVIVQAQTVDFPTPLFRYVVHIFPKMVILENEGSDIKLR